MKILIYSILISIFLQAIAFSQPMKMRERLLTVKKVKMVEFMKLPEEKTNKLLITVTKYEDKLINLNEQLRGLNKQLEDEIKDMSLEDIKKINNKIGDTKSQITALKNEKFEEVRKLLDEKEFAKYQVFEYKFAVALKKHIIDRVKNRKNKNN